MEQNSLYFLEQCNMEQNSLYFFVLFLYYKWRTNIVVFSLVHLLLDEIVSSTLHRCLDPVTMEPSVCYYININIIYEFILNIALRMCIVPS